MENPWLGLLTILAMCIFYFVGTRWARQSDVLTQLSSTLRELRESAYTTTVGTAGGDAWLELHNDTTRIRVAHNTEREELSIDLFLPRSEPSGANTTRLLRTRNAHGILKWVTTYQRVNKLREMLLYYMEGVCVSRKVHTHFDHIVESMHAHHLKNEQAASM